MAKRWIFYLALNIFVSAATMLAVLYLWNRSQQAAPAVLTTPTLQLPHGDIPVLPTVETTPTPFLYTVKSGDTLGSIAEQFGVGIDELIALNNIEDPNWLEPGMTSHHPRPRRGRTGRLRPGDRHAAGRRGIPVAVHQIGGVAGESVSRSCANYQSRGERRIDRLAITRAGRGRIHLRRIFARRAGGGPGSHRRGNRHLDRSVLEPEGNSLALRRRNPAAGCARQSAIGICDTVNPPFPPQIRVWYSFDTKRFSFRGYGEG